MLRPIVTVSILLPILGAIARIVRRITKSHSRRAAALLGAGTEEHMEIYDQVSLSVEIPHFCWLKFPTF